MAPQEGILSRKKKRDDLSLSLSPSRLSFADARAPSTAGPRHDHTWRRSLGSPHPYAPFCAWRDEGGYFSRLADTIVSSNSHGMGHLGAGEGVWPAFSRMPKGTLGKSGDQTQYLMARSHVP